MAVDVVFIQDERVVFIDNTFGSTAIFIEGAASAQAELAAHVAAADPHPQYTTAAEVAASFQPLNSDLTAIAALDSSTAGVIASDGAGWLKKTYAQFKTALGLVKGDVGLANVDNTSDANKPVSTAQANADAAVLSSANTHADSGDAGVLSTAQAYADGLVVGLWDDRGSYNASGNTFPASGGSGPAGAIKKGDIWTVSVTGTLGGTVASVGDTVRALADVPGQTAANWALSEHDIGYVPENASNKDASGGYAGLSGFKIKLKNALGTVTSFFQTAATVARTWTMPDKDGTVAMTSDVITDHAGLTSIGSNTHTQIDTALARLANTSGSNTGDQDLSGYATLSGGKITLAQTRRLVRTAVKTGAYNAAGFDLVPIDASAGNVPINLPNAPEDSTRVAFKLIAVGAGFAATVSAQGADVYNKAGGTTAATLSLLNQAMVVEYDAAAKVWTIVSNDLPLAQMDARYGLKAAYVTAADGVTITPALIANDTTRVDQTNTQAAGTLTLANPTGSPVDGEILIVRATCSNAQTLAFGTSYRGTNQLSLPAATTGGGKTDRWVWEYKATALKWDLIGISSGA